MAFVFCRFKVEIKADFCIEQFFLNVNLPLKFCSEYLLDLVFPFQFSLAILKAILIQKTPLQIHIQYFLPLC